MFAVSAMAEIETMENPLLAGIKKDEASDEGFFLDGTSLDGDGKNGLTIPPSSVAETASTLASKRAKSLSMAFMKSLSGLCCDDCKTDPFNTHDDTGHKNGSDHDEYGMPGTNVSGDLYNLQSLQGSLLTISPLVSGPMLLENLESRALSGRTNTVERIIGDYICFCKFYQVQYNSGILTTLRFSLPCLRVSGPFHDTDMLALVELLLRHANGALQFISRLDFTIASKEGRREQSSRLGFTSHGALALAKALQTTKRIRQVLLPRHRIGPYGASAIFMACQTNPTIQVLNLRRCRIGKRGAFAFCELILGMIPDGANRIGASDSGEIKLRGRDTTAHGLVDVDLSCNTIGHAGTSAIELALAQYTLNRDRGSMVVNLEGNHVFPEIMNGITHGVGVLLSLLGGYLLSQRVAGSSLTHVVSCGIYTMSLVCLYLSSTLYHSFFSTVNTRYVFKVMDKCAIYILIAGSYTPLLQILLIDEPVYSYGLLGFLWLCGGLGISVEAMYPTWKWKGKFSLSMYLAMGWSALVCLPEMKDRLPVECVYLLFLGGVGYTAGVPFFVRDNNLDHAIWHLFVLSGSMLHWFGIYLYVAPKTLI